MKSSSPWALVSMRHRGRAQPQNSTFTKSRFGVTHSTNLGSEDVPHCTLKALNRPNENWPDESVAASPVDASPNIGTWLDGAPGVPCRCTFRKQNDHLTKVLFQRGGRQFSLTSTGRPPLLCPAACQWSLLYGSYARLLL